MDEPLSARDLDGHTDLFGFKFTKRDGLSPLITVYVEDDENYFEKMTFDIAWLPDLCRMAKYAATIAPEGERNG